MASLKEMRDAANAWAAQEKTDIESGAKKVPLTSREKIMAENKAPKLKDKYETSTKDTKQKTRITAHENLRRIGAGPVGPTNTKNNPAVDLGEKYPGTTGQTIENARNTAKGYRAAKAITEGRLGDPSEYTDFSDQKNFKPNMPAAAQSRMDADKPLKTALVREVEPGRSRSLEAKMVSKFKGQLEPAMKQDIKMQSAAETGEAQAFVGQTVPNPKTGAGKAIRYEQSLPKEMQSKGLGRAEAAQTRLWAGEGEGGQIWGHNQTYVKDNTTEAKDLGEAVPGASKAQGLRGRAIARSVMENRQETTDAAAKKARTDKAFSEMTQEKAPNQSKVNAGGQRFAPKLTADPRVESEFAGQTKSNIERPNKDLGRITTRLIRSAGTEGSNITEAGGGILKSALGKRLGQFVTKVSSKVSVAAKAASKFGGALGIVGGIAGASDARQQYQDMLNSPNKMDLKTGKVVKRVNPRIQS